MECGVRAGRSACFSSEVVGTNVSTLSVAVEVAVDSALPVQELLCPQLPPTSPARLAIDPHTNKSYSHADLPLSWTCPPDQYYELSRGVSNPSCDCECGVVDPDCGFQLPSCDNQVWNPPYTKLRCGGEVVAPDLMYCRLESARSVFCARVCRAFACVLRCACVCIETVCACVCVACVCVSACVYYNMSVHARVSDYARVDHHRCETLPPGLSRGGVSAWTCIPDVYGELRDSSLSLHDCDCNCGSTRRAVRTSPK